MKPWHPRSRRASIATSRVQEYGIHELTFINELTSQSSYYRSKGRVNHHEDHSRPPASLFGFIDLVTVNVWNVKFNSLKINAPPVLKPHPRNPLIERYGNCVTLRLIRRNCFRERGTIKRPGGGGGDLNITAFQVVRKHI